MSLLHPIRHFAVDPNTQAVLDLVDDLGHVSVNYEWRKFLSILAEVVDEDGMVNPNALRYAIRKDGSIFHKRVGGFTNSAKSRRVLIETGEWTRSDDTEGRNSGKPAWLYRLDTEALLREYRAALPKSLVA